jgi:hypothetical protein
VAWARELLHESGVVAFDDVQARHAPGVAAAVWAAVENDGLRPIVISHGKLYGTWGSAETWQDDLLTWLPSSGLEHEVQQVAGGPLIRVWQPAVDGVARAAAKIMLPAVVRSHISQYRKRRHQARF